MNISSKILLTLDFRSDNINVNIEIVEAEGCLQRRFSESRPLAVKAAKLRIQLPPAESRKPMRAVSAALRLLRAGGFLRTYGWNRGACCFAP